jgi:hypothetical protein
MQNLQYTPTEELQTMYLHCAKIITTRTLLTTNYLFHLAYVLTPVGREAARQLQLDSILHHVTAEGGEEEEVSPEDMAIRREIGPYCVRPGIFDELDEDDNGDVLTDPLDEGETPVNEDHSEADLEEEVEDVGIGEEESESPSFDEMANRTLFELSVLGLDEILLQYSFRYEGVDDQYHISPEQCQNTKAAFQQFVSASGEELTLRPNNETNRFPWGFHDCMDEGWRILSEIALRLQSLVCNEAVSERTNSAIKRVLGLFRLKMGHDPLLQRLTVARHGPPPPADGAELATD